jgi:5'-nucleotidase / UDP-sugar diphosphatase
MRRHFRWPFLVSLVVVFIQASAVQAQEKVVKLTILHTNDTHGHLLPYSYPETFDTISDLARLVTVHNIGGAARRATLISKIRSEKDHRTLLIDAGDICDGTPFSTEYHGDADMAVLNALKYDIACPGNHEYSNELPQVRKLIASAKFPYISANSTVKADGKTLYAPYVVKKINGAIIAFFGLMTYSARTYPGAKIDLKMEEPIKTAARLVPELRKQADFVIAVTHIGVQEDRQLAAEVPGIDVIVGGHSHTLLPQPLFVSHAALGDPHSVNGTVIVQDFQWAGTLGRLDLTLHRSAAGKWAVEKYEGNLLPITSDLREDRNVAALVNRYWKPIASKYGEVIGTASADFSEKGPDHAEYHLMADAVRSEIGAEIVLENMGGVRAPIIKGPITYGDLTSVDPFPNTIVTFDVTGKHLKEILARVRPAVSGIRYEVSGRSLISATIDDKPIDDDRVYRGVTNSFFAGLPGLKDISNKLDTGKSRLATLIAYIRKQRTVSPAYDGRRVLRNARDFE